MSFFRIYISIILSIILSISIVALFVNIYYNNVFRIKISIIEILLTIPTLIAIIKDVKK